MATTVEIVEMRWYSVTVEIDDVIEAKARALGAGPTVWQLDGQTTFVKDAYPADLDR